jgi:hypothetical protein
MSRRPRYHCRDGRGHLRPCGRVGRYTRRMARRTGAPTRLAARALSKPSAQFSGCTPRQMRSEWQANERQKYTSSIKWYLESVSSSDRQLSDSRSQLALKSARVTDFRTIIDITHYRTRPEFMQPLRTKSVTDIIAMVQVVVRGQ